ncbi:MAK10-like protein [Tanacetum coccineum]
MGDANPICTIGDYSKPSHKGYRNTIELPKGNNVVPLRSDTIWLVQNGCSFHGLRSEDPNQHLKDFLKLVDSLDLNVEEEKDVVNNRATIESTVEPSKSEEEESPKKAFVTNKFERRADDKPTKSEREKVTKNKAEEAAGASSSHTFNDSLLGVRVGKIKGKTYNLSPRWPVYEVILKKKITKKKDIGENFEIPCNIGGLTHINSLVDQGSDVNVMPFSTYRIAKDVLVDVAGYVYPMDFVILDIKEDEKRPFILGTPFLTTAKAVIKFDKGTITLRSGKSKISFYSILESLCKVEKGIKNDIEPIAPTMTINRLVLEWKEKIKLHQEKETKFDQ